MTDQGRIVASTAVWPNDIRLGDAVLRVGGINLVGTLPAYRRQGVGERLMQAAQVRMAELGCHVGLLSTDIANWYRAFGWERAGIVHTYRFDRANIGLLPLLPDTVQCRAVDNAGDADDEVIPALCALHNADCLGAIRTPALLRTLLARKPSRTFFAAREGKPSAYVLLRDTQVFDWAGSAADIAGLVRAAFDLLDDRTLSTSTRAADGRALSSQRITVTAPAVGHPLTALLTQARIPVQVDYAGMLYVVAPGATLRAFGRDSIQVREDRAIFTLDNGHSRALLNRNQLAKLFFGPERVSEFAEDIFPLPFWQWGLEKV
jgi:predicted acetyltransferase